MEGEGERRKKKEKRRGGRKKGWKMEGEREGEVCGRDGEKGRGSMEKGRGGMERRRGGMEGGGGERCRSTSVFLVAQVLQRRGSASPCLGSLIVPGSYGGHGHHSPREGPPGMQPHVRVPHAWLPAGW